MLSRTPLSCFHGQKVVLSRTLPNARIVRFPWTPEIPTGGNRLTLLLLTDLTVSNRRGVFKFFLKKGKGAPRQPRAL